MIQQNGNQWEKVGRPRVTLVSYQDGDLNKNFEYEEIELSECQGDQRQRIVDYWNNRNNVLDSKRDVAILCPNPAKLKLEGDQTISKYKAIQVDYEYCFESRP